MESKESPALFLQSVFVSTLVNDNPSLVWGPIDISVKDALKLMQKENIHDLPLAEEMPGGHLTFHGIFTCSDLAAFLLRAGGEIKELNQIKALSLLGLSSQSKTLMVFESTDRMEYVLRYLGDNEKTHSLVKGKHWYKVLSQCDVVGFLHRYARSIDWFTEMTVNQVMRTHQPLSSVRGKATAFEALQILVAKDYDAVPCVDESQKVSATFAVSDLRKIFNVELPRLDCPLIDYLKAVNGKLQSAVTCTGSCGMYEVLSKMKTHSVERLWVLDEQERAVGVIAFCDVLKALKLNG